MSGAFDPYYQWLGIPPREQPPNHYRLLGLALYESNPDVIENAADRQMAHVRTHQSGKHAEASQRLLNEIAAAKLCLLVGEKKAAYDAQLRAKTAAAPPARKPLKTAQPLPKAAVKPSPKPPSPKEAVLAASRPQPRVPGGPGLPLWVLLAAGGAVAGLLLLAVGTAALWWLLDSQARPPTVADAGAGGVFVEGGLGEGPNSLPERPSPPVVHRPPNRIAGPSVPPLVPPRPADPADDGQANTPAPVPDPVPPNPPAPPPGPPNEPPPISPAASFFPPEADDTRQPLPDEAERDDKRKQIDELFEIGKALKLEERAALAGKLLKTGRETKNDAAAQFALFDLARELASEAGEPALALEAAGEIDANFQVDGDAVRIDALSRAARAAIPAAKRGEVVDHGIKLVERLFDQDRYVEAARLISLLQEAARKNREREPLAALARQQQRGSELFRAFRDAREPIDRLKADPADAEAALAAGKYFALAKGDWQLGLPMLAAGSDEALKKLAEQEMAVPADAAARRALADAWRDSAENFQGIEADRQKARAAMWYKRIEGELSGLAKAEVQKYISEIGEVALDGGEPYRAASKPPAIAGTGPPDAAPPSPSGASIDLVALVDPARDAVRGSWQKRGGSLITEGRVPESRILLPYEPASPYRLELEATYRGGNNALAIGLVAPTGEQFVIALDSRGEVSGISLVDGKIAADNFTRREGRVFEEGKRERVVCEVTADRVVVTCDGETIVDYQQGMNRLSVHYGWKVPNPRSLFVGAVAHYEIHSIRLTPLGPSASESPSLSPAPAPAPAPSLEGPIDLLALADVQKDATRGPWRREGNKVIPPRQPFMRLKLPCVPPKEYDLEVVVTATAAELDVILGLVASTGKPVGAVLEGYNESRGEPTSGLHLVGGRANANETSRRGRFSKAGEPSKIHVEVRETQIRLTINGEEVIHWRGDPRRLAGAPFSYVDDPRVLYLGSHGRDLVFHSVVLTPVTGQPKLLRGGSADALASQPESRVVELLPLADIREDVVSGAWQKIGGRLISPRAADASIRVPYLPAGEYDLEVDMAIMQHDVDMKLRLPYGGEMFTCVINAQPDVQLGRLRTMRSEVRQTGIQFFLDGKPIVERSRDPESKPFRPNTGPFELITTNTVVQIHSFRIKEIGPAGRPLRE